MSPIMKNRQSRPDRVYARFHLRDKANIQLLRQLPDVGVIHRVFAARKQCFNAILAATRNRTGNIQKQTVHIIVFGNLKHLLDCSLRMRVIQAKAMPSSLHQRWHPCGFFVAPANQPLRVVANLALVQPDGKMNRGLNPHRMRGLDLPAKQIEREIWVPRGELAVIVHPAMRALCRESDGIDMSLKKRLLKRFGVKV